MSEVTRILSAIEHGDPHAADQLLPLVYDELRKLAAAKLSPHAVLLEGRLVAVAAAPGMAADVEDCGYFLVVLLAVSRGRYRLAVT